MIYHNLPMSLVCAGGQGPPDGTDTEEAERCPICLGVLAGGDLAMPDSCCHVFCLRCLLTWAEVIVIPRTLNSGFHKICDIMVVKQRYDINIDIDINRLILYVSVAAGSILPCGQKTFY